MEKEGKRVDERGSEGGERTKNGERRGGRGRKREGKGDKEEKGRKGEALKANSHIACGSEWRLSASPSDYYAVITENAVIIIMPVIRIMGIFINIMIFTTYY